MYQVIAKYNPKKVAWRYHPLIAGQPVDSALIERKQKSPVIFDLTALAQNWCSGVEANFGVLIKARNELQSNLIRFYSSEWDDSRYWPVLEFHCAHSGISEGNLTLDLSKEFLATNEWAFSSTLDVLLYDYTYVLTNRGDHPVEACLQLSMNGSEWYINIPDQLIYPHSHAVFIGDTIMRFARLRFRTPKAGLESKIQVHIQGRKRG